MEVDTAVELSIREDLQERNKHLINLLDVVYLSRYMDEKMNLLVKQNKGGTFHMNGLGHELVGAVCSLAMRPGYDFAFPYYRDKAFAIGYKCCIVELFGSFMGRATHNHSSGRMMPEHFCDPALHIPVQSSVVGSQFLQAVGLAKGLKLQGKDSVVYVSAGDGATSQGDFHEALNFACLHQLSVIFVIQDNKWAISVPLKEQVAGESVLNIASGYSGLSCHQVDGTSYEELIYAMQEAVKKGRLGLGPSLIVADVPRLGPHSSSDDPKKYKDENTLYQEQQRDPLKRFSKELIDLQVISEKDLIALETRIRQTIDQASKQAEEIPFPDPKTAYRHVFKDKAQQEIYVEQNEQEAVVMVDALNHALVEEMREDPSIVVFGQDVAHGKGGVFGVTRQLTTLYGSNRCFNTPLAESTIIGVAIGLAFDRLHKPVAEIQFADYLWTGINQLFNELASIHYRSNGQWTMPVVIRMPIGGYIQGGPYHSQSIEAFLAHCPGLKIVFPSNAYDAKVLLKAAIRDPNPVLFLEHKALYRQRAFSARKEALEEEVGVLGQAKIVRKGSDLTLISWGMALVMSHEVAERLASTHKIDIELIDLRTLVPLDWETLAESIKKTGKVLIAHEAPKNCGFGAEISARIVEKLFPYLDAPVIRVGSFESAVPYSKPLEEKVLLQKAEIEKAALELASF